MAPVGGSRLAEKGEDLAARWYERAGFAVLARNWRCPEGELDLVTGRDRLVVFCEVKTRSGAAFGVPAEAVTRSKQRRLRILAVRWLAGRPGGGYADVRFDVAAVTIRPGRAPVIEVIEAAF